VSGVDISRVDKWPVKRPFQLVETGNMECWVRVNGDIEIPKAYHTVLICQEGLIVVSVDKRLTDI
jgi:hypothetical protein